MCVEINKRKFSVLIEASEISEKVIELGSKISQDYRDKDLVIICVLKGGLIFFADLIRHIQVEAVIDFIWASSYKDSMEPGEIELLSDIKTSLENRDILLVEDLIDSGATLDYIRQHILSKHPKSLKICALIKKDKPHKTNVYIDYLGFEIADKFIVGYGTDYAEQGRNLPDIYVIDN